MAEGEAGAVWLRNERWRDPPPGRVAAGLATLLTGPPLAAGFIGFIGSLASGDMDLSAAIFTLTIVGWLMAMYGWPYLLGALLAWAALHATGRAAVVPAITVGATTAGAFCAIVVWPEGAEAGLLLAVIAAGVLLAVGVWMATYWQARPKSSPAAPIDRALFENTG